MTRRIKKPLVTYSVALEAHRESRPNSREFFATWRQLCDAAAAEGIGINLMED